MNTSTVNSYYYGDESNQFSFFRIPRQLITGERFQHSSTDAKLLYGLLLDRMGLSEQNGWYDENGRVYIYYTLREIQRNLNCGQDKAIKLLAELDQGCDLIDRVRQGQGLPTKIYVKKCSSRKVSSTLKENGSQDFGNSDAQTSENQTSRLPIFGSLDLGKTESNYTEENQTDLIYTDPSINPSKSDAPEDRIDGCGAENTENRKQENEINTVCDNTQHLPAQAQTAHFKVFRHIRNLLRRATAADNRDSGASRRCHSQHGILTSKFRWLLRCAEQSAHGCHYQNHHQQPASQRGGLPAQCPDAGARGQSGQLPQGVQPRPDRQGRREQRSDSRQVHHGFGGSEEHG